MLGLTSTPAEVYARLSELHKEIEWNEANGFPCIDLIKEANYFESVLHFIDR